MKLLNFTSPKDYLALIVRRKWWVLFPFFALSAGVIVLTYILPKMYVSESLVVIRPRDVPQDFVKDLIAGSTEQRLAAVEQTVLSRTHLVQILHEFEEDLPEYRRFNLDQKVEKLHGKIKVDFEAEKRGNVQLPVTYFRISYQNRNPELAQKIAKKLTSLLIDEDNRARSDKVFGTTEFLQGELSKVSDALNQSETNLQKLKARHRFELPENQEGNLRTLDRLALTKQSNAEAIDRSQTFRLTLERQISETPATLPQQGQMAAPPKENPLIAEYQAKRNQLDELTAKYKADYPDVQTARIQLEKLKAKLSPEELEALENPAGAASEANTAKPAVPNPIYQQLLAQLEGVKTELALREREKKQVEEAIAVYNQRVANGPQSEQELEAVMRQNADLKKQYDELKTHLAEAKLAESLESRQKGSQFQVVDEANYPLAPTKPSKTAIALGGIAASLLIGIVIAFVADISTQKIWTPSEVEALLGMTVLAEIPEILTTTDLVVARKKRYTFIASSVALAAVYGLCLYGVYVKQGFILRHLDTVIQKFY